MNIKLGSLFDGIGGFPYVGTLLGIEPIWASEIEPFPIRVTEQHFPNMKHLGDITQINGGEIEPVDIITFGSPCQDLSVAGKREGLAGARSGLFMEAVRIIREMRTATGGQYPRFAVWENVPGAYSSNKGEDFRAVLEEITETEIPMPPSGKWATAGMVRTERVDVAWRTLDAQYWGVPQRRKRIFLVADFAGQCAGEILFKREGLSRHLAESGEAREEAAGTARGGTCFAIDHVITTGGNCTAQGPCVKENGPMFTLKAAGCHSVAATVGGGIDKSNCLTPWDVQSKRIHGEDGVWPTLYSHEGGGGAHGYIAQEIIPFDTTQITSPQNGNNPKPNDPCHSLVGYGEYAADKIAPPIRSSGGDCGGGSDVLVTKLYDMSHGDEVMRPVQEGLAPTLNSRMGTGGNQVPVMMAYGPRGQHDVAHCLRAEPSKADKPSSTTYVIQSAKRYAVRRLTPLECERLQGFLDGWTNIEGAKDTNRYKAIGNSVAIPCVLFVLGGIARVLKRDRAA